MKPYIPNFNDQVLFSDSELYLPDNKLIEFIESIFYSNKKYKIEKIISFSKIDYFEELKEILSNKDMELYNHYIDDDISYFHITFEKKLEHEENYNCDYFCPYALSLVVTGIINRNKYIDLFNERVNKKV